jgi:hypothetical protein
MYSTYISCTCTLHSLAKFNSVADAALTHYWHSQFSVTLHNDVANSFQAGPASVRGTDIGTMFKIATSM